MPCNYSLYPKDWKTVRVPRILARAGNKCERCGLENGLVGTRFASGEFVPYHETRFGSEAAGLCAQEWAQRLSPRDLKAAGLTKIVLTVAHLDRAGAPGTPEGDGPLDCPDDRLQALCQRCHLLLDAPRHAAKRRESSLSRRAAGSLFETLGGSPNVR